ncbi:MAG: hypothetical protein ABWX96_20435 [Propionibacteriaceae bacterium]
MQEIALFAGLTSTTLFVTSYLPMLYRALRTRDLRSYSRPSLVLANVGNVIQAVYVYNLPVGPIWFLHGFYLVASALMLGLHLTSRLDPSGARATSNTTSITSHEGGRHDGDQH